MRHLSVGILAVSFLCGTANAEADAAKEDLASLQGGWQLISLRVDGKALPKEEVKKTKLTFKGNKASHPGRNGKIEEGTFKLDPSKRPKAIDMISGGDKGKPLLGIYSIDGDSLKLCVAKLGVERPTEFKAGKDVVFMVLKREKP
ncbi:MAG: TIGR03067 domain-containing protein [Planctomycetes bacterium]|nr:TIGR03067 domain-containing protein [Planctomycetota bacterium]